MAGYGNNTLNVTGGGNQFVVVYRFASPSVAGPGGFGGNAPAFGAAGSLNNTNPDYDFTTLDNGKIYTIDGGQNELTIEGGNKQFVVEYILPENEPSGAGGNAVTIGGGNNKFVVAYDFSSFAGEATGGNSVTVNGGNNEFVVAYELGEANNGAGNPASGGTPSAGATMLSGPGAFGQGGTGNNSSVIAGTAGDNKVDIKGDNNKFVVEYGNSMSGAGGGGNPFAGGAGGMGGGNPFAGGAGGMSGGNPFAGGAGGMGGGNPFAGGAAGAGGRNPSAGGGAAGAGGMGGGNPFAGGAGGMSGGNPFAGGAGGMSGGAADGGSPFENSPLAGLLMIPGVENAQEAIDVFANGADPAAPSSGMGGFGGAGGGNPFAGGAGGGNPFAGGMGGQAPREANPDYVYDFGGNAAPPAGGGNPFAGGAGGANPIAGGAEGGGNPFAGGAGSGNPFAGGAGGGGAGAPPAAGGPGAGGPGAGGGMPSTEELESLLGQSPFGRIGDAVGYDQLAQGFFSALGNQPPNAAAGAAFGGAAPGSNPFSGLGTTNNPATARGFGGDSSSLMGTSMLNASSEGAGAPDAEGGFDPSSIGGQLLAGAPVPTGSGLIGGDAMETPPLFAA